MTIIRSAMQGFNRNPFGRKVQMQNVHKWSWLVVLAALALVTGCSKDHSLDSARNPADPQQGGTTPPTPSGLSASVNTRSVELDWSLTDSTHVAEIELYRIYQLAPDDLVSVRVDSIAAPPIRITGLDNGSRYRFRVSTVLRNGLEGARSSSFSVTPAIFGIVIEADRENTNRTNVNLSIQAPGGTQGLKVSNASELGSVAIRPFSSNLTWSLSPGDGIKTVYAQIFDAEGNASPLLLDSITLDTRAEIQSVTFSPEAAGPGDLLHFRLDAGESFGTASVQLGEGGLRLDLRDDGTGGDTGANNGIYELDYTAAQNLEIFSEFVTGFFSDEAGNAADSRIAPGRLTVHQDPEPVVLSNPTSPGPRELGLSWTQASDGGRFSNYRVYRDIVSGVAESVTRRLLTEIFSQGQTSYGDEGLDPGQTYFYVVEVVDSFGNAVPSNEVSGETQPNEAPVAVVLSVPTEVTETSISLSFTRSFADDFSEYRVYRSLQPDVLGDPDRRLLTSIGNATQTTFVDRDEVEENRVYYYTVTVVDELGEETPSNIVSATTPDRLPEAVTLSQPSSIGETSVLLAWSDNSSLDFDRYEIRRSLSAGVSESATLVASLTDEDLHSFLDLGLTENTDFYYRVFVVDRGGNASGSNELNITTTNADPDAVTLAALTEDGGQTPSVRLQWTRSNVHDFEQYQIFRDTSPGVSEASTSARSIFDASLTEFTDSGLDDNTRYYYRVFVTDDAAAATGSNEQVIVTVNRAPSAVSLSVSATAPTSISLSWSENNDPDFDQYRLYQGTSDSSFPTLAAEFSQREQTGHTVFVAANDSTVYFFKVVVYDQDIDSTQRLTTDSNIISAQISTAGN